MPSIFATFMAFCQQCGYVPRRRLERAVAAVLRQAEEWERPGQECRWEDEVRGEDGSAGRSRKRRRRKRRSRAGGGREDRRDGARGWWEVSTAEMGRVGEEACGGVETQDDEDQNEGAGMGESLEGAVGFEGEIVDDVEGEGGGRGGQGAREELGAAGGQQQWCGFAEDGSEDPDEQRCAVPEGMGSPWNPPPDADQVRGESAGDGEVAPPDDASRGTASGGPRQGEQLQAAGQQQGREAVVTVAAVAADWCAQSGCQAEDGSGAGEPAATCCGRPNALVGSDATNEADGLSCRVNWECGPLSPVGSDVTNGIDRPDLRGQRRCELKWRIESAKPRTEQPDRRQPRRCEARGRRPLWPRTGWTGGTVLAAGPLVAPTDDRFSNQTLQWNNRRGEPTCLVFVRATSRSPGRTLRRKRPREPDVVERLASGWTSRFSPLAGAGPGG